MQPDLWKHAYQAQYGHDPDQELAALAARIDEWRIHWQGGYDAGEEWALAMVADIAEETPVAPDPTRENILRLAAMCDGLPYVFGGNSPSDGGMDCSGLVLYVLGQLGIGPGYDTTAQGLRQWAAPISEWGTIQPGDLLFFRSLPEDGYHPNETPGPDGFVASHVGFSYGAGTLRMHDANSGRGTVGVTDIRGDYWQQRLISAGRVPALNSANPAGPIPNPISGALSATPEHQFTLADLYPHMEAACAEFGFDPKVLAAICYQESGFRNWRVHHDGTGAGLFGFDDNGLLPDFERWSGLSVGRGYSHAIIPPEIQIRYASYQLKRYADHYGDVWAAARAWHRGGGLMNDTRGQQYEQTIRAHVRTLFG